MQIVMADESGFAGEGYFAMAGYVADHELWAAFNPYWNAILRKHGVEHFHMKDFAHCRAAFDGWDEGRRRALMADLLEIITSAPIRAIGACMKLSDFTTLEPAVQERFVAPFFICFQEMVLGTGLVGADAYPIGRIDFVYSRQDQFKRHMERIWAWCKENRSYGSRLGHLAFLDMRTVPGLQAADLLVYEFRHAYHLKPANRVIRSIRNFGLVTHVREYRAHEFTGDHWLDLLAVETSADGVTWTRLSEPPGDLAELLARRSLLRREHLGRFKIANLAEVQEAIEDNLAAGPERVFLANALEYLRMGDLRVAIVESIICIEILIGQLLPELLTASSIAADALTKDITLFP